jgi:hypothetical protein
MLALLPLAFLLLGFAAHALDLLPPTRRPIVPPVEPAPLPPPFPMPTIKVSPEERPIELSRLEIRVAVRGLESETTTTMTFRNPNPRQLAGELEFPLPDDAAVTGYALDVAGRMVDGVVVSKEKARVVMETEMRRRVDPGIVEHVRGNAFRTRVYPIPPNGERTVRVVSVASLKLSGGDAACHVPLPRGVALPSLKLDVEIARGPVKPVLGGFGNLKLTDFEDRWTAGTELSGAVPQEDLYIRLPALPKRLSAIEAFEGGHYLSISDEPPAGPADGAARTAPARIGLAWDASGSRSMAAVARDREFLAALFGSSWRDCEVDLVVFRDRPEPVRTFALRGGNAAGLFAVLDGLAYDGGTDLSALDLGKAAPAGTSRSAWLLFTDGLHTMGSGLPAAGGVPVHVIASDSRRDIAVQRFTAERSGGLLLDIAAGEPADAARTLADPPVTLMRVDAAPGVLADVQYRLVPGSGRATVNARLLADGEVTLVYGRGGVEVARHAVQAKKSDATPGRILARAWAATRVADLSVFPERNDKEMLALGQRYGMVTPNSSLIVLETLQQYVTHGITPPDSWPEMRDQYLSALKGRRDTEANSRSAKVERVLGWWRARVAWWERKFEYAPDYRYAPANAAAVSGREVMGIHQERPAALGMAPPEPAPMAPAAMRDEVARADMAVRGERSMRLMAAAPAGSAGPAKSAGPEAVGAGIAIKPWEAQTPYLSAIKARPAAEAYAAYLGQRESYATSPSFYLDCAGYVLPIDRTLGLRILSNLAELKIDDPDLLRVFAWRLREAGELDRAVEVLEKVRTLRPEEPQSHRDLALALSDRMDRDRTVDDGLRAARLLCDVIEGNWTRFEEIEVVALMELNRLLATMERIDPSTAGKTGFVDPRLRKALDLDVRIVMSWDANHTDIDLHVLEPSGEEAFYGHNLTTIGGHVSRDFTQGYGPEEYVLRKALPGVYRIRCKYYGSSQQTLLGPATVTATVITNFGRPGEKRQALTLRLDKARDMVDVGEVTIGATGDTGDAGAVRTVDRQAIGQLKAGMEESEVRRLLGEPERVDGGALRVFVYRLDATNQLRLEFAPALVRARQASPGAELEIPLRK